MHFPTLLQINTRVRLTELTKALGRPATFDDIPDEELDGWVRLGFEWVWTLGVWQTGEAGLAAARAPHAPWRADAERVLPDFTDADLVSSPFAITAYTVHTDFGGDASLARLRARLAVRGIKLLLDFVPNHSAPDHPWIQTRPEFYVHGSEADLAAQPQNYRRVATGWGERILAHGRDPYFDGWTDTFQLNYRHKGLRHAMIVQLAAIAERCDGVRCDMAMLVLPHVIHQTWGDRALPADGSAPCDDPFWPAAIHAVHSRHPEFQFMAEVYWDLEWTLQQQGFHWTYDKRLYDRLHAGEIAGARDHLKADRAFQDRLVRFLENHDEPRVAEAFAWEAHQAAAVVTYFVPGLRFFHDGQLTGRRWRVPMQVSRLPVEPIAPPTVRFYESLLKVLQSPVVHTDAWRLLDPQPHGPTAGDPPLIAVLWEHPSLGRILACSLCRPTAGTWRLADPALAADEWQPLLVNQCRITRESGTLEVAVEGWGYGVFAAPARA